MIDHYTAMVNLTQATNQGILPFWDVSECIAVFQPHVGLAFLRTLDRQSVATFVTSQKIVIYRNASARSILSLLFWYHPVSAFMDLFKAHISHHRSVGSYRSSTDGSSSYGVSPVTTTDRALPRCCSARLGTTPHHIMHRLVDSAI